jgi:hypothetical protein
MATTQPVETWLERARATVDAFAIGELSIADAFTLVLALGCLPRDAWPTEVEAFGPLLAPAPLDPSWAEALYLLVQDPAIEATFAGVELLRAVDRATPERVAEMPVPQPTGQRIH